MSTRFINIVATLGVGAGVIAMLSFSHGISAEEPAVNSSQNLAVVDGTGNFFTTADKHSLLWGFEDKVANVLTLKFRSLHLSKTHPTILCGEVSGEFTTGAVDFIPFHAALLTPKKSSVMVATPEEPVPLQDAIARMRENFGCGSDTDKRPKTTAKLDYLATVTGRYLANARACKATDWKQNLSQMSLLVARKRPNQEARQFGNTAQTESESEVQCDATALAQWRNLFEQVLDDLANE